MIKIIYLVGLGVTLSPPGFPGFFSSAGAEKGTGAKAATPRV
jgi:hypothetical protein